MTDLHARWLRAPGQGPDTMVLFAVLLAAAVGSCLAGRVVEL